MKFFAIPISLGILLFFATIIWQPIERVTAATDGTEPSDPPAGGRTVSVFSNGELTNALGNAQAGDQIVLSGTFSGFTMSKSGTADNPIVIRAGQVGGATINGVIQANGQNTWFHGFRFVGDDSGIDVGADNITITRNSFTGLNGVSGTKQHNIHIGYNEFTRGGADVARGSSSQIFFNAGSGLPEGGRIYRNYFTSPQSGGQELHHIYIGHQGCKHDGDPCLKDFIIEYNLIENTERQRSIYLKYGGTIRYNQCNGCHGPFGLRHGNTAPGNGGVIWGNRVNGSTLIVNGSNHDVRGNVVTGATIELRAETLSPAGNQYQAADNALVAGNTGTLVVGKVNDTLIRDVRNVRICNHSGPVRIESAQGTTQQDSCDVPIPQTVTLTRSQVGPGADFVPTDDTPTGGTTGATTATGATTGGVTTGTISGGATVGTTFTVPSTACTERYTNAATIPSGYGAAYNVFGAAKETLLHFTCNQAGDATFTVDTPDTATQKYVYKNGFRWTGAAWVPITFTGTPAPGAGGDWLLLGAHTTIQNADLRSPSVYSFFAAYTCTFSGGAWKCGCRDTFCASSFWQLQAIINPIGGGGVVTGFFGGGITTGGTTGGTTGATTAGTTGAATAGTTGGATAGTTGGNTGGPLPEQFAPITECGSTINVTPSTLSSNIGNGCKILVMAPGSYALNFSGHSGGVLTLRCETKGTCDVQEGSHISESDGLIIDGIKMETNCTSSCSTASAGYLTFTNVGNLKVENSTFSNMLQTGVLIDQSSVAKQVNIQLVNNLIHNDINRSFQISGSGRWSYNMDYGFRIHNVTSVYIAYNTFSGGFSHAVSLKQQVKYALIEHNNFITCGNACIMAGQQGDTSSDPNNSSDLAEIRNNTFGIEIRQNDSDGGVEIMNIHKAVVTDNTFTGFPGDKALHTFTFHDGYNGLSGYIHGGYPADRQFIQSGNTFQ